MRILFLHHFPLSESAIGRRVSCWAGALADAGHDARILLVDSGPREDEPLVADRIVCHPSDPAADLPFDLPRFSTPAAGDSARTFGALSDEELAQYREQLRRRLDAQVDRFNPDVIHAQYAWVQGQLAVETGAPYVLNIWGPELVDCDIDPRYRTLADQAATNASRILTPDLATLHRAEQMFEIDEGRALVAPKVLDLAESDDTSANRTEVAGALTRLYQTLLDERFGAAS